MLNLEFGLPPILSSVIPFSFGIISLSRKPSLPLYKTFAFLCLSVTTWSLFYGIYYLFNGSNGLLFPRIGYLGVVFIPTFTLHFIILFLGQKRNLFLVSSYITSLIFLVLSQTDFFMEGNYNYFWGPYPKAGPIYILFVGFFALIFLACIYLLSASLKTHTFENPVAYNQVKFVFLAFVVATSSIVDYIPNYGIEVYPSAYLSALGWISLMGYATLRFKLMDFNLILRWGIAYSIFVLFLGGVFFGTMFSLELIFRQFFRPGLGLPTILTACLIVLIFEPMRRKIERTVDQLIFKSPDFNILLNDLQKTLGSQKPIEEVSSSIAKSLKEILKIRHVGIGVWDNKNSQYSFYPDEEFRDHSISKLNEQITKTDFLIRTLETERRMFQFGIVSIHELAIHSGLATPGEKITFEKIKRTMRWLGASIAVPIMNHSDLMGLIIIGEKENKTLFSKEDKKFLSHVSNLISIAYSNSNIPHAVQSLA